MTGSYTCKKFCPNCLFASKDKFAKAVSTDDNETPISILAILYISILGLIFTLVFAPSSNNKLLKQLMKAYLKA